MVIDHDHVETEPPRLLDRSDAGRAAIDRDQQLCAALRERADRLEIRPIAFKDAVGNVDQGIEPTMAQEARQHRGRGRAVDVVIAEDRHLLAALDRVGQSLRRRSHVGENFRIGHEPFHGRVEIGLEGFEFDAAPGEDARQQLGDPVALHDRERAGRRALVEPVAPGAAGHRALHVEKQAPLRQHPRSPCG